MHATDSLFLILIGYWLGAFDFAVLWDVRRVELMITTGIRLYNGKKIIVELYILGAIPAVQSRYSKSKVGNEERRSALNGYSSVVVTGSPISPV